jgi:hypothetical protein
LKTLNAISYDIDIEFDVKKVEKKVKIEIIMRRDGTIKIV